MGKSKRRIIARGKYNQLDNLSRDEAVKLVVENMQNKSQIEYVISLFGLKAEELLEAGAGYEEVKSLGSLIDD